jgi:hypothetical protein
LPTVPISDVKTSKPDAPPIPGSAPLWMHHVNNRMTFNQ